MTKLQENEINFVSVRLVKDAPVLSDKKINCPETAVEVMGEFLREMDREAVTVINLKSDGTPINFHIASMGSINASMFVPREIFKAAILSNAAQVIVLHCHPSGSLLPSKEDIRASDMMIRAGGLLGIPVIDHIIVGAGREDFFSFKEKGMLNIAEYHWKNTYEELEFEKPLVAETKPKKTKRRIQEER